MSINDKLIEAVKRNDPSSIRRSVEEGADVNHRILFGIPALMIAAGKGYTASARALLEYGADVNAEDNFGYTSLNVAEKGGYTDLIKLLKEHGGLPKAAKLSERLIKRQLHISFSCGQPDCRIKGLTTGLSPTGLGARVSGPGFEEIYSMRGKFCTVSFDEIDLGFLPVPGRVVRVEESYEPDYDAFVAIAFNPHSIFFNEDELKILEESIRSQLE